MSGDGGRTTTSVQIHLDLALALLASARAEAAELEMDVAVAVLDGAGNTVLSARVGAASFAALDVAVDKSFTAAAWRTRTAAWAELSIPGQPGWGLAGSLGGRASVLAGGVPIWEADGQFLGALGVSGGTPVQDEQIALRVLECHGLSAAAPGSDAGGE